MAPATKMGTKIIGGREGMYKRNGTHKGCRYKDMPVNYVAAALVAAISALENRVRPMCWAYKNGSHKGCRYKPGKEI